MFLEKDTLLLTYDAGDYWSEKGLLGSEVNPYFDGNVNGIDVSLFRSRIKLLVRAVEYFCKFIFKSVPALLERVLAVRFCWK